MGSQSTLKPPQEERSAPASACAVGDSLVQTSLPFHDGSGETGRLSESTVRAAASRLSLAPSKPHSLDAASPPDRTCMKSNNAAIDLSHDFTRFIGGRKFKTILADPPWQFQNRTGKIAPEHKRLSRYSTLTLAACMGRSGGLRLWCTDRVSRMHVTQPRLEATRDACTRLCEANHDCNLEVCRCFSPAAL